MSKQELIADFVEKESDQLACTLSSRMNPVDQPAFTAVVRGWLENYISVLRKEPCRVEEWAAQFVEYGRKIGVPDTETYTCIQRLCKALLEYCLAHMRGIAHRDIQSYLSDPASLFEQAVVNYVIQQANEGSGATLGCQKAILEFMKTPMAIMNGEGVIEVANPAFLRLFHANADALAGFNMMDLCDAAAAGRMRSFLSQKGVKEGDSSFAGTFKFGRTTVEATVSCKPFVNDDSRIAGAVVLIEPEKAEQTEMDTAIRYVEERLLPLLPLAIQVSDREGNISFSSEHISALSLDGYDGGKAICCFLYHQQFGEQRKCPCSSVFDTGCFHMDEISFDTRSEMKWFRILIVPFPDDVGGILRVMTCVYETTQRVQIQKQMENHIIKQQRSSLVSQLSITVAHQLRNPLSVVLGFAEMMSKGLPPEQYAEAVNRILRNSLRCKDIVESLLDFGKGNPLERRAVDFEVLVRESVRTLLTPAQNRRVEWRFSGKPMLIECVPEQMAQVVLSLLDHALCMARSKVVCSTDNKGELIRMRVVDDGPGIPLDLREHIFDPFFTTRREEGATGLGLSLARAVVTDYGGSLTVSAPAADEPRGACLVLQLPLMKNTGNMHDRKESPAMSLPEQHILIVDDDIDMLDLLKISLYQYGILADTVATGMEALEKLKQTDYDAIVLDYRLKGVLSCRQLYREIAEQYAPMIDRVIFFTGDMLNPETHLFLKSTGCSIVEKPFHMDDLLSKLNGVMTTSEKT